MLCVVAFPFAPPTLYETEGFVSKKIIVLSLSTIELLTRVGATIEIAVARVPSYIPAGILTVIGSAEL